MVLGRKLFGNCIRSGGDENLDETILEEVKKVNYSTDNEYDYRLHTPETKMQIFGVIWLKTVLTNNSIEDINFSYIQTQRVAREQEGSSLTLKEFNVNKYHTIDIWRRVNSDEKCE